MGSLPIIVPVIEDEETELISNLEQIIASLELKSRLGHGNRKIIANLGSRLINLALTEFEEPEAAEEDDIEHQLSMIQGKIMSFELNESSMIWDSGPENAYHYLKSLEEVDKSIKFLESKNRSIIDNVLLNLAHDLLQRGMAVLEKEFTRLLLHNLLPFVEEETPFWSSDEDNIDESPFGDEICHESAIRLFPSVVIMFLKSIANLMFSSNYGNECVRVYIDARRVALDECLSVLKIEKLSIEDVSKMQWKELNSKIRKWLRAIKPFVEVHLVSEKALADEIFGAIESVRNTFFVECSRASFLVFLSFCEGVSISPRRLEKLPVILDMYEVLAELIPKLSTLYSSDVISESQATFQRLRDCVKATFNEFESTIASYSPDNNTDGGVHVLTRYVMNYLNLLTEWRQTFDELMQENDTESENDNSPIERHFRSIVVILERNLDEKSKLYKDDSLRQIFLMNNTHYMVDKVKGSDLRTILEDEWIKIQTGKIQYHALQYRKTTWNPIISILRYEKITKTTPKKVLKERLESFYFAFEEIRRTQTRWSIPDPKNNLKNDFILSISSILIEPYRSFIYECRHHHIKEWRIKYTPEAMNEFLWELFSG